MLTSLLNPPRRERRRPVIALHCSGGGASQWCHLTEALGGAYAVLAPELYGSEAAGPWPGEHAFALADEAASIVALIDASDEKVHLVGHSYGGGVALKVALSRPGRIAGMALYEPTAFHLLKQLGTAGEAALAEVASVASRMGRGIVAGDYRGAVAGFVDYWNGAGAWDGLKPQVQSALVRWAPKGPLDFRALIEEPTPTEAYRALRCPVLLLRGEHAPGPARLIAESLAELLPMGRLAVIRGAGHMGPLTHAAEVAATIARHIAATGRIPAAAR
jgi:pimeloyl-ACP methyl ester carboxylesterase